jgi:hypothetical protein
MATRPGALLAISVALVVGGCGASRQTSLPSGGTFLPSGGTFAPPASLGPAVLGLDWGRAASVERPINFEETVSPSYPGTHPILRIAGQAMMTDVVATPAGGLSAIGYVPPDWTPTAWTSSDGQAGSLHPIGPTPFTFPVALASGGAGLVAVGRSGSRPVAWTSADGVAWTERSVPVVDAAVAERMTSIVVGPHGFVAGGSAGPELFDRHARFWTSTDGSSWTAAPDDAAAFADAEVRAISTFDGGFVAVGVVGSVQQRTGAVAWTSRDGMAWQRIDDPTLTGGLTVALTAAPFGGLVAVGSDLDRREAAAWTSPDGAHWTRAPSEPSRVHGGGYAWMTDVMAIGDEVVGIGEDQGLQRGTGTAWVSRDGSHWDQARTAPVQEQAELYAVAPGGPGLVVVGSYGAPDSYVPIVLVSPAH